MPSKDPSDKSQQDVCEVYNAAFGCSTGEQCGIVNGEPVCEYVYHYDTLAGILFERFARFPCIQK